MDDLFYTSNELVYCRNIFQQGSKNEILYNLPPNKSVTIYSLLWLIKNKLKFFARYFFDYKSSFKYSLRFLCTQFACFFCNYYLIVFIIIVLRHYTCRDIAILHKKVAFKATVDPVRILAIEEGFDRSQG